ncbi:MAG: peptidoglycan-associated lipoprotein Pal [Hahellaceae bacterium]|nr:peptidoglycan-associated lipoprotein Pal [Hahellaceae bacterium]
MAKTTLALVISTALLSGCGTTGNKAEGVPADDQQTSGTTFGAKNTGTLTAEELAAQQAETARKAEAERMARLAEAKSKEQAALRAIRTFYFDFDKYEIKSEATLALSAHAAFIAANPSVKVVVEGHADERGTKDYNLALGEKRAKAVERFLIVNGVARNQIESVSYGEERPAVMGHEESSWAKNRRAVIAY